MSRIRERSSLDDAEEDRAGTIPAWQANSVQNDWERQMQREPSLASALQTMTTTLVGIQKSIQDMNVGIQTSVRESVRELGLSMEEKMEDMSMKMEGVAEGNDGLMLKSNDWGNCVGAQISIVDFHLDRFNNPVLPMSERYCKPKMFVRDCYSKYYEYLTQLLICENKIDHITISGTPGIGKSMFYNWFFDKYRTENPNKVIVCASFHWLHKFQSCYVFVPNKAPVKYGEIPEIKNAMYFYDNSPLKLPKYGQMVAFACPNDDWFRSISARKSHMKLYMPVWEFDELLDAIVCLGIRIGPKELTSRFNSFGGVPRYCLCDGHYYHQSKRRLFIGLNALVWDYRAIRENLSSSSELCHKIFHQVPFFSSMELNGSIVSVPYRKTLTVCSKAVIYKLSRFLWNFENYGFGKRVEFIKYLLEDEILSSLMSYFFEAYCYDFFSTSDSSKRQEAALCIDSNEVSVSSLPQKTVFWNPSEYTACPTMVCESVDAFEYNKECKCLNLFFATMEKDHAINANRIVEHIYLMEDVLQFPNLAEDIIMGDMKLRFVFLIPEGSVAYSRQTVTRYTTPLGGTDAVECDSSHMLNL